MEVPEPPSMGTTGSLLMEQIPKVRQSLTRGHDWEDMVVKATSPKGEGAFCTYDDANDPDVKSVAALFAEGEHEDWAGGQSEECLHAVRLGTGGRAVEEAKAETRGPPRGTKLAKGGNDCGGGSGGGESEEAETTEAPASSVRA